jgi:hypothetical protein
MDFMVIMTIIIKCSLKNPIYDSDPHVAVLKQGMKDVLKRMNWHTLSPILSILVAFILNVVFFRFKIFICKTNYEKTITGVHVFSKKFLPVWMCLGKVYHAWLSP